MGLTDAPQAIGRTRREATCLRQTPQPPGAGLHSRCVAATLPNLGDAPRQPCGHRWCDVLSPRQTQTKGSPSHVDGRKSPPIWSGSGASEHRPQPPESTRPKPTPTSTTSQRKQMVRKGAESDRVDKRNTRLDLREKRPTFAALERRGCGEIGRHARLRIWCFGVGVRVPPPAHFQETLRQQNLRHEHCTICTRRPPHRIGRHPDFRRLHPTG